MAVRPGFDQDGVDQGSTFDRLIGALGNSGDDPKARDELASAQRTVTDWEGRLETGEWQGRSVAPYPVSDEG